MSETVITLKNVGKSFKTDFWKKKIVALDDISFEVGKGQIFGLIGPNGAGKTTTIKILMGLIRPTVGDAKVLGEVTTSVAAKSHIGYLPEGAYYYDYLRTEEVVDFYGRLFGFSRAERDRRTDELLELVGMSDRRGLRLRQFSKGMLQRIGIAQALVNDPDLVILDEPMSGLDPIGRKDIRDIILRIADKGKTILFSSHILSDVEAICERVAILIRGKLRSFGAIEELVKPQVKTTDVTFQGEAEPMSNETWNDRAAIRKSGDQIIVRVTDPSILTDVISWGGSKGLRLLSVTPHKETLEDIFLEKVEEK